MGIINVNYDTTEQVLISYSVIVKYLRENGNTRGSSLTIYMLQESPSFSQEGGFIQIHIKSSIPKKLVRYNKMC